MPLSLSASALHLPTTILSSPALSILLPFGVGNIIGYSTRAEVQSGWYGRLRQPPFSPPPVVFGPVWTMLYIGMGYAAHRVWKVGNESRDAGVIALAKHGLTLYTISLGLNFVWTPLFFKLKMPAAATVDCAALAGVVGYMTYVFGQVDETAGWLLAPYAAWAGFATYLAGATGYLQNWDFKNVGPKAPELRK